MTNNEKAMQRKYPAHEMLREYGWLNAVYNTNDLNKEFQSLLAQLEAAQANEKRLQGALAIAKHGLEYISGKHTGNPSGHAQDLLSAMKQALNPSTDKE